MKSSGINLLIWALLLAHPGEPVARSLFIAHRGASHDAPENTLAAFRLAWKQNADGIEADFFLTKDEQIVCIHDDTTKRTAGVNLRIADSIFDQLRQLDVGSWKDGRWSNERIPRIDEVLETVPKGKKIYVEVKCGPEIVPPLERAFAKSRLTLGQIVVISFRAEVVAAVKKATPGVKAFWLVAYHKDQQTGKWGPTMDEIIAKLQQCQADGLGTEANREVVDPRFIQRLRRDGFEIHAWTIDDLETARYFATLGVDSIITNRPAFLRNGLDARGR